MTSEWGCQNKCTTPLRITMYLRISPQLERFAKCYIIRFDTAERKRQCRIILAMVSDDTAVVQVLNWIRRSDPVCSPETRGAEQVRRRVRSSTRFQFMVPTTYVTLQYLSSDHIATWSISVMFRLMIYFIFHSQICDPINFHWVAVK